MRRSVLTICAACVLAFAPRAEGDVGAAVGELARAAREAGTFVAASALLKTSVEPAVQARRARLAPVNDWAYQLQGDPVLALGPIGASAFDLVVIDYSADGGDDAAFDSTAIGALKASAGGEKIVLAYMSIGEAEIGRFYWDNRWVSPDPDLFPDGPFTLTAEAPAFLAPPNPLFPDNFKVRFWDADWRAVVVHNAGGHPILAEAPSYLDRIVDAGFDGVYLDIIDAFEYFGPASIGGNGERPDAAAAMMDLVAAIARHARETRGDADFLVFPQNGSPIVDAAAFPLSTLPPGVTPIEYANARASTYLTIVDGIGAEDSFYFGDADEDNPLDPQFATIGLLDVFRAAGLTVLAVDYLTAADKVDDFYGRARARGWIPYASVRALDVLTIHSTQPPD